MKIKTIMSLQLISIFGCDNNWLTISVWPLIIAAINGVSLNKLISIPKMIINLNIMEIISL